MIVMILSSYFFLPFCIKYTLVVPPLKFNPVILIFDFNIGDEDALERAVIWGAMDRLYTKVKVAVLLL